MRSFDDGNEEAARFAAEVEAFGRDTAKARIAVADLRFHLAMRRARADIARRYGPGPRPIERRFDPRQPRVPAGHPDGGQWTATGGGAQVGAAGAGRGGSERLPTGGSGRPGIGGEEAVVVPAAFMPGIAAQDAAARLRAGVTLGLGAAITLYNRLFADPDPVLTPVIEVERSTAFPLDKDGNLVVAQVRAFPREEIASVCPSYDAIQTLTTEARDQIDAGLGTDGPWTPQSRGTAIHMRVAELIKQTPSLAHVKTEMSLNLDGTDSYYGEPASIRVDELELSGKTVCIYDTKTGRSGLTFRRMLELSSHAAKNYEGFDRIVVTEVRP